MIVTSIFLFSTSGLAQSEQLKERSEINRQYQWKTEDIFVSDEAWEKSYATLKSRLDELSRFQGKLAESAEILRKCLQTRDTLNTIQGKLSLYANLKSDEDTRITKYQGYREQISNLGVQFNQKKSFIHPEILSIPPEKIQKFWQSDSELNRYRHYLEDLFRTKQHVLSPEGEELLALSGDLSRSPSQIFSMFNNADIKFPKIIAENGKEIELTKGNFMVFLKSSDQKVRQAAFTGMYSTYQNWLNTLSASLAGAVKKDVFYARARKYDTALQAALDQDSIPTAVYDNLLVAMNQNLSPMHQYIRLRKEILGLEMVHPWDLYVPLLKDFRWEVTYEEGVELIQKALKPLGNDYLEIAKQGFNSRWFDIYENQGKRSGAYSAAAYGVSHPFMLLNYQGFLNDVLTVAHEMGHSLHSYFTIQSQPYIYSDYTIFVAEVASTLNEALLMDYLLKNIKDKQKKLYLLNEYIDQIRGTLYIQTIFAEFEKTIHQKYESGEALTAEFFSQTTKELYQRYYGPAFEMDPLYDINWCRIPHFYYNFYVYQYATGISAATALSQKILAGDKKAREAYLNFLKRGSSDYSIDLLKDAGVDMTSPEPIEATARLFANLLTEMEKLLKE
jgi:oligoendopeptidase F